MKDYLFNLTLAATTVLIALAYYFGHDTISRLMINGPTSLMRLVAR
ncbi:MAG TPA: hypothetical protein VKF36_00160 [Syntrophorhabdales bacterium]|jgi:hypothetical protein|nr:hypothetical protein [Syntrophorhabdales bacterium]